MSHGNPSRGAREQRLQRRHAPILVFWLVHHCGLTLHVLEGPGSDPAARGTVDAGVVHEEGAWDILWLWERELKRVIGLLRCGRLTLTLARCTLGKGGTGGVGCGDAPLLHYAYNS